VSGSGRPPLLVVNKRTGGGRNEQKVNEKRQQSAQQNLDQLKKQRDALKPKKTRLLKTKLS